MRLLAVKSVIDHPDHFGMDDDAYRRFMPMLDSPNGIIYITGPTGGKSTTLYLVLEALSGRSVNISTIRGSCGKNVARVNQMQVNNQAGVTFDVGLRALLRQDPDIIMVGETRDSGDSVYFGARRHHRTPGAFSLCIPTTRFQR